MNQNANKTKSIVDYFHINKLTYLLFVSVTDLSDGCGGKFDVIVVSPKFEGKPLLARQRMVNAILEEEMKTIHALTQKTLTPEQWAKKQQQQ